MKLGNILVHEAFNLNILVETKKFRLAYFAVPTSFGFATHRYNKNRKDIYINFYKLGLQFKFLK